MISCQDSTHNIDAHFVTSLDDDCADPFSHCTMQNLAAIFYNPNDMGPVVKSRMRRLQGEIKTRSAEADWLKAGSLSPIGRN
jgi:hypothetical protein